jgi:iron(II)-dependent oxidoreductase
MRQWPLWLGVAATLSAIVSVYSWWIAVGTAAGLLALAQSGRLWARRSAKALPTATVSAAARQDFANSDAAGSNSDVPDSDDKLVSQMLSQCRYSLLLWPQIALSLQPDDVLRAWDELDERMALVPTGDVLLRPWRCDPEEGGEPAAARIVPVGAVYLDRYPITNRQFYEFVTACGYEQIPLWDEAILPGLLDFVDRTGRLGPRFWNNGHYPVGEEDFPVVGISWYEALAYARWAGKRLPTDAEWVKAAAWPIPQPGAYPAQRRFPWGDEMDRRLANVWGSGPGRVVSVREFAEGMSVGGAYQLIGNVWEWTASSFNAWGPSMHQLELPAPMKSIRGGAFDTYFDNHANCSFSSGESPLSRKHNIGFRCVVGVCDVVNLHGTDPDTCEESAGDNSLCAAVV